MIQVEFALLFPIEDFEFAGEAVAEMRRSRVVLTAFFVQKRSAEGFLAREQEMWHKLRHAT